MNLERTAYAVRSRLASGQGAGPAGGLLLIGVLAMGLAGCQTIPSAENVKRYDYRLRHPIVIAEQAETLDIPVGAQTRHLSPRLAQAVRGFARDARTNGAGSAEILVPSGSLNEGSAQVLASRIRAEMVRGGLPRGRIHIRSYPVGDPGAVAPIRVAYPKVKASVHPCGRWTDDLSSKMTNEDYADFGCATQSNLAAMVANPADLIQPRNSGPADRARRDTVFDKYREGSNPSGDYKEGVGAKVSNIGN